MLSAEGTPFDLQFPLGRIPVRVLPTFWIAGIYLGWNPDRPDMVAIWVACLFFSILIHELGHALVAEAFGYPTEITLYHFGGFARFNPGYHFPPSRSLLISLAGPFAQFFLAGITIAVLVGGDLMKIPRHEYADAAYFDLLWINIAYPVLNLFPLLPLDGGQILQAILGMAGLRTAALWTLRISIATGILGALLMVNLGATGVAVMFGLLVMQNVQDLQARAW
ncbi:MAG TPA: site-2 protease family protein [Planctomycetaceae bacterium]|nr:site-2 protease family protein [Planctomycetaceae bacterium]